MIEAHGFQTDDEGYKLFVEGNLAFCTGAVEEHQFKSWVVVPQTPHNLLEGFSQYLEEPKRPALHHLTKDMRLLLGLLKTNKKLIRFPAAQYKVVKVYAELFNKRSLNTHWFNSAVTKRNLTQDLTSTTAGCVVFPPADQLAYFQVRAFISQLPTTRLALVPVFGDDWDMSFDKLPAPNPNTVTLLAYEAILHWTSSCN